jgi:hypothetical protein
VTITPTISNGSGGWTNLGSAYTDGTNGWRRDGVLSLGKVANLLDLSSWAKDTYDGHQKYWIRLVVNTQIVAACTIAEIRVLPMRAVAFSAESGMEQEASAALCKVLRGRRTGARFIWDDVYTLPPAGRARRIIISPIPTKHSDKSLLVCTLGLLQHYPLPTLDEPTMAPYPRLYAQLAPPACYYPSAVDLGSLHRLKYVQCVGQNFAATDEWDFSFRWDDTHEWKPYTGLRQADAIFPVPDDNFGSILSTAFRMTDAATTDPVGPSGRRIVAWVEPLERGSWDVNQPARTTPEVS